MCHQINEFDSGLQEGTQFQFQTALIKHKTQETQKNYYAAVNMSHQSTIFDSWYTIPNYEMYGNRIKWVEIKLRENEGEIVHMRVGQIKFWKGDKPDKKILVHQRHRLSNSLL